MRKVLRDVCLSVMYGAGMIAAGVSAISLIFGGFVGAYWVLGDRLAQAAMLLGMSVFFIGILVAGIRNCWRAGKEWGESIDRGKSRE